MIDYQEATRRVQEFIIDPTGKCERCLGGGKVADDADGWAWLTWLSFPPGLDQELRDGSVNPVPCPDCNGSGKV